MKNALLTILDHIHGYIESYLKKMKKMTYIYLLIKIDQNQVMSSSCKTKTRDCLRQLVLTDHSR